MKILIIFIIFLVCRIIQFTFMKKTSGRIGGRTQLLSYTAFQYLVSALLSLFLLKDIKSITTVSPAGLLISVLGGVAMFCSSLCSMTALKNGVLLVLTSLFSSVSILIPTVASVFLFEEAMSFFQIVAVVMLLYSACLLLGISRDSYRNFSWKALGLLLGLFAADGVTMLAQKCYPNYDTQADTAVYTFLAFGTAFVLTGAMSAADMVRSKTTLSQVMNKGLYVGGTVLAVIMFTVMYLGILAVPLIPAVILYSLVAGGTLIVAFLVGTVIFHEPVTKKNILGLVISVVALILINAL